MKHIHSISQSKVLDSRAVRDFRYRRRECRICKFRFSTYERVKKND